MRKLTGRKGDADGHTLHLGPSPKVNNVQGAIWQRLGKGGQKRVEGAVGGGKGCNEHKHMEKQIFFSPCSSQGRQMSACAASTHDCAALSATTWPSLLSHRVWAAVTLWNFPPGQRKASRCSGSSTCTHVHQHLLHPLLFFTQEIHKETVVLCAFTESCRVLAKKKKPNFLHFLS